MQIDKLFSTNCSFCLQRENLNKHLLANDKSWHFLFMTNSSMKRPEIQSLFGCCSTFYSILIVSVSVNLKKWLLYILSFGHEQMSNLFQGKKSYCVSYIDACWYMRLVLRLGSPLTEACYRFSLQQDDYLWLLQSIIEVSLGSEKMNCHAEVQVHHQTFLSP